METDQHKTIAFIDEELGINYQLSSSDTLKIDEFEGGQTVSGLDLKQMLLYNLTQLPRNPAVPEPLRTQALTAYKALSICLDRVWVVSYADKAKTRPKKVNYSLLDSTRFRFIYVPRDQMDDLNKLATIAESNSASQQQREEYDERKRELTMSAEAAEGVIRKLFNSEAVRAAIQMAFLVEKTISENISEIVSDRLFPNSKDIDKTTSFLAPKAIVDHLALIIKNGNQDMAIAQYKDSGDSNRTRKPVFSTKSETLTAVLEFEKDSQVKRMINTAEEFANQLLKVKDAKVLQTFFALLKWANLKDTSTFHNVPVSDLMEIVLKSSGTNKFNKEDRKNFSTILEYLASISITVSYMVSQPLKSGKKKTMLRQERGVKLFRLIADYSLKKEFQHIPERERDKNLHFDQEIITRFSGELFPGNSDLFTKSGMVYFDSLLTLDANKDSKAILLGFQLQTRFNQRYTETGPTTIPRHALITLCDYQKTDTTKPSKATKQLDNVLDKLKGAGIISKYTGLTNDADAMISIYPPASILPIAA